LKMANKASLLLLHDVLRGVLD